APELRVAADERDREGARAKGRPPARGRADPAGGCAARERRGADGGRPADGPRREAKRALVGERRVDLGPREARVGGRSGGRLRARHRGATPARRRRASRRRAQLDRQAAGAELLGGSVDAVDRRLAGEPLVELPQPGLERDLRLVAEDLARAGG